MSFLVRRSSKKEVLEECSPAVFGRSLEDLLSDPQCQLEVPAVVVCTSEWLLANGLRAEGIFRISGTPSETTKLKFQLDKAGKLPIKIADTECPHVVASVLKQYIRELPEPLLLYRYYSTFLKILGNTNPDLRMKNLRIVVQKLPQHNRNLLVYLCRFLKQVVAHQEHNKMTLRNLATVWAPNILREDPKSLGSIDNMQQVMAMSEQATVLVSLLIEHVEFFAEQKQLRVVVLHPTPTTAAAATTTTTPATATALTSAKATTTAAETTTPSVTKTAKTGSPLVAQHRAPEQA